METDQPYQFHDKVKSYYPGDYFVNKVKVKEKGGKPDKAQKVEAAKPGHDDSGGDDDRGKGRGKGKKKDK